MRHVEGLWTAPYRLKKPFKGRRQRQDVPLCHFWKEQKRKYIFDKGSLICPRGKSMIFSPIWPPKYLISSSPWPSIHNIKCQPCSTHENGTPMNSGSSSWMLMWFYFLLYAVGGRASFTEHPQWIKIHVWYSFTVSNSQLLFLRISVALVAWGGSRQ